MFCLQNFNTFLKTEDEIHLREEKDAISYELHWSWLFLKFGKHYRFKWKLMTHILKNKNKVFWNMDILNAWLAIPLYRKYYKTRDKRKTEALSF